MTREVKGSVRISSVSIVTLVYLAILGMIFGAEF